MICKYLPLLGRKIGEFGKEGGQFKLFFQLELHVGGANDPISLEADFKATRCWVLDAAPRKPKESEPHQMGHTSRASHSSVRV